MATQPLRFSDYFWGTDFTSFAGFETLCTRLKHGKHTVQELEEFLKLRAKIEENYGRELIRLAKQFPIKDEIGTLKASWESLKTETENLGNAHVSNAKLLTQEHDAIKEFKEKQRAERKKTEESVKKVQSYKKSSYDKEVKAKKAYEKSCRDSDHADEAYQKTLGLQKQKQIDDAQKKAESARGTVERMDAAYKDSVRLLDEARVMWEREMELCCSSFQDLERERISFMRSSMWKYANIQSKTFVDSDETNERVRQTLEKCDPEADNDLFVQSKQTGMERPAPIQYENFYDKSVVFELPTNKQPAQGSLSQTSTPVTSFANRELPEIPVTPPTTKRNEIETTHSVAQQPKAETSASGIRSQYTLLGIPTSPDSIWVEAAFDYEAQGDQELTLHVGDLLEVLDQEDDTWWKGRTINGEEGMFPVGFTEPHQRPV